MTSYHHGNLRAELILSAVELAREQGPDGVVIREVARRTGVSHNAAYRHFADRDDLLDAVARVGSEELTQAMMTRVGRIRGGEPRSRSGRRLREIGRAYVQFALAQPGLFAAAFAPRGDEARVTPEAEKPAEVAGPYQMLGQALDEMVAVGAMPASRRAGAEVACWSAVHGFAVLHIDGPLSAVSARERVRQLDALLDTLESGLG